MANWHAVHGFSPRTGSPTDVVTGGWVRRDPEGHEHFPRTDAAIIVGVTDADDRILLGSNAAWDTNRTRCSPLRRTGRVPRGRRPARGVGGVGRARRGAGVPRLAAVAVPGLAHGRLPRSCGGRRPVDSPTGRGGDPRRPLVLARGDPRARRRHPAAAGSDLDRPRPSSRSGTAGRWTCRDRPRARDRSDPGRRCRPAAAAGRAGAVRPPSPDELLAALDAEQQTVARTLLGPRRRARGRRHGQDPRDHAPHRVRGGDGYLRPEPRPRPDLHDPCRR